MPVEERIPLLRYPVDEHIYTLEGDRVVSVIRLKGISHETRDDDELIDFFHQLNRYFVALGKKEGKNLMIQTWITKTRIELNTEYAMPLPALQDFVDAYTAPFRDGTFLQVGYSLALILKYRDLDEGIRRMRELLTISKTMLNRYDPAFLALEENEHGALYSQIGRFFSLLINGHDQDVLVSDTRLGDAMIDSVTSFDQYDFIENRPNRGGQRFATTYDLRDYPGGGSYPGMWDEAIEQQFEFTLVQSFLFEDRNQAKISFKKHVSDLGSVEGDSKQTQELEKAIQDITMGEKAFGRYHASLLVWGKTPDEAIDNGAKMESVFTVHDATFVRSTMSNIDTCATQFPGVTEAMYPMIKSTENLACSFSLHAGDVSRNPRNFRHPSWVGSTLVSPATFWRIELGHPSLDGHRSTMFNGSLTGPSFCGGYSIHKSSRFLKFQSVGSSGPVILSLQLVAARSMVCIGIGSLERSEKNTRTLGVSSDSIPGSTTTARR